MTQRANGTPDEHGMGLLIPALVLSGLWMASLVVPVAIVIWRRYRR